jgi:hypothetical protein
LVEVCEGANDARDCRNTCATKQEESTCRDFGIAVYVLGFLVDVVDACVCLIKGTISHTRITIDNYL